MEKKTNIAIISDQTLFSKGFSSLLEQMSYTVAKCTNQGAGFLNKVDGTIMPDLILIDAKITGDRPFELTSHLAKEYPLLKVLALLTEKDRNWLTRFMRCGARGYLEKRAEPEEIKLAFKKVLVKGGCYPQIQ